MKKLFLCVIALFMLFGGCVTSPTSVTTQPFAGNVDGMTLDQAIAEAAIRIEDRIMAGSKIAPLNFNSTSDRFSTYVLDELTANLVENGKLVVVDRSEIDLIRSEFDFQYSGEVGDDSMQALGRMLGAQSIISGSLTDMGGFYRIMIRVLNVQNASVEVQYRANIVSDHVVTALLTGGRTNSTVIASGSVQQTQTASTQQGAQTSSQQNDQLSTQQTTGRSTTYRVGDSGPAGGIIFYDKGVFSNGWRYLEAAPADYEIMAQWGLSNVNNINTITDIGRGKSNTETLVLMLRERSELDKAAELCTVLEINGYNDWFLPSSEELKIMYTNLKQRNLGGFSDNRYWSSTFGHYGLPVYIDFKDGAEIHSGNYRNDILNVRAIRQF